MKNMIIDFFKQYNKKISINDLIKHLKIDYKEYENILDSLYDLEKEGFLYKDEYDLYMRTPKEFYLKHGIINCSNKNNCYIKTNEGNIIIHDKDLNGAKVGDIVFVEIISKASKFNKFVGKVNRVVKRLELKENNKFIIKSTLKKDYKNNNYYITIDKKRIYIDYCKLNGSYPEDIVSVQINGNKGSVINVLERVQKQHVFECKIKDGEISFVPVSTYPFSTKLINCNKKFVDGDRIIANINENNELEFVEKIDNSCDLLNQIKTIILDNGISFDFPINITKELDKLPDINLEIKNRVDLRGLKTFTIDPECAKDLDDAISIVKTKEGYELYIHVADVSYYVRYLSMIYEEAKLRCTSAYFGNFVIPMLPTVLSEDFCSLIPNTDKLAKTLLINLDKNGNIIDYEIFRSVISSNFKMTYERVDELLYGNIDEEYQCFYMELLELSKLSLIFESIKQKRGYIGFKVDEYDFSIIDNKVNIFNNKNGPSHLIVENCMLLANECLTSYMHWLDLPIIYRNHEMPDCTKLNGLKDDLREYNYHIRTIKNASNPKVLQKILLSMSNKDENVKLLSKILLQYMKRAFYSESNLGHYGLALEHYSTFTSPIRRLPDLVNHLVLDSFLDGNKIYEEIKEDLHSICKDVNMEIFKIEQLEKEINCFLLKNYIISCENEMKANIKIITKDGLYIKTESGFFGLVSIPNMRYDYSSKKAYIGDDEYEIEDEIIVEMIDVNKDCEILFRICKKIEKRKKL